MPNINLRLTDSEHAELREWARGSRRSIQREIVFRLFDGAVTERVGSGSAVATPPGVQAARSVTAAVQPKVHDVGVRPRAHMRGDRPMLECEVRVPAGEVCSKCGRAVT